MKKAAFLLLLSLTIGCKKNDPTTEEVEVQTQGRNLDCGFAQVTVKDPTKVAQLLGASTESSTYLALKLDTALWVRKNQVLLLRIRRPTQEEATFFCTALGLAYPALTVVSARVK
jgi:hypothetical protein